MPQPPEWRPLTDEDRRLYAEMLAKIKKDDAEARKPPLTPAERIHLERVRGSQPLRDRETGPGARRAGEPGVVAGQVRVGRANRVIGALLALRLGDALGAAVEFSPWHSVHARYPEGLWDVIGGGPFDWPPGHATDDTDLTRAVLLAYLDQVSGRLPDGGADGDVVRAAADHMLAWLDGDWPGRLPGSPPKDIGGATARGLARYRATRDPRRSGAGPDQAGNGSLMRCLPTGLVVREQDRRIRESVEISAITHDDDRCTVACAAYNEIVAALCADADAVQAVDAAVAVARALGGSAVVDAIEAGRGLNLVVLADHGPRGLAGSGTGYVLDSLSLAVSAVLDPRPPLDVLVDVVAIGGDTDTNAAVAGGLLGARDGDGALPGNLLALLQFRDEFVDAARVLGEA